MRSDRQHTDLCACDHWFGWHDWIELGDDGIETPCKMQGCDCWAFVDKGAVVVRPGHDQFGTERAFLSLCKCVLCTRDNPPPPLDVDLLLALKDNYDACMDRGVHPEWTIGGA